MARMSNTNFWKPDTDQYPSHEEWKALQGSGEHLYHATNLDNALEISRDALRTFRPWHGTDQRHWPDGSREKRSYFSHEPAISYSFAPEEGKPVLLRTKRNKHFKRESTGDFYLEGKKLLPHMLEILTKEGWKGLASKPESKQPVKMARMSRKKPRAWNPFPYLRAIRGHFSKSSDPHSQTIVQMANDALQGNKDALMILGDALQESHEPEWFQTIVDHNLAWPPWQGTGLRSAHKAPQLTRYGVVPVRSGMEEGHRVYNYTPLRRIRADDTHQMVWMPNQPVGHFTTEQEIRAKYSPLFSERNVRQELLTPQELSLLSSPSRADVQVFQGMAGITAPIQRPISEQTEWQDVNRRLGRNLDE